MRRFTYSICLLIISICTVSAQKNVDAEKLISDFLNSAKFSAIKTDFKLSTTGKNAVILQSESGSFLMKGNKFVLEMKDLKVWFDGKTQWSYLIQNNEVSITEPTEKELGETNPMAMLSGYKNKFTIRFSNLKSNQYHIIEMIPKQKNVDFNKAEIRLNKSNQNLNYIKISSKNGNTTLLTLSDYQKGLKVNDTDFVFDKSSYKGVTVNDLR